MSTLAEELAVLVTDRDSFTVRGKLAGQNKIDYDETVQHYAVVIQGGLNKFAGQSSAPGKTCWVCFQPGADTKGTVNEDMPNGKTCPAKLVNMHGKCKADYSRKDKS